ncbi:MAG: hypothetical protein LBJ24_07915, partial [Treponema sp.]|nr:hypothetical protein [Treponema sp.]
MADNVPLKWLEALEGDSINVTWGVPWKEGELPDADKLVLYSGTGKTVPVSSWVIARWPDKSVKWTAHAAVLDGRETYSIAAGDPGASAGSGQPAEVPAIRTEDRKDSIAVETDRLSCVIPKSGPLFIKDLKLAGKDRGMDGKLFCRIRLIPEREEGGALETTAVESWSMETSSAVVEQASPGRVCVKAEGKFSLGDGTVPFGFTVRLYFYSGSADIRLVHTALCDIDQKKQQL